LEYKTYRVPQVCCRTTLQKVSGQLYSFTAQLIQFTVMQRCLITVNVYHSPGMLLLFLSMQINLNHVYKMSAFGTYACFQWCMPLVNGWQLCIVQCCVKHLSSPLKGMSNTKCRNDVTMMSASGRKIIKQIKTHETDTIW